MPAAGLRIDTSIAVAGPSSSRLALSTPASARSSRLRSASSASTSSSISGAAVQAEAGPSNFPQAAYAAPRISWSFEQSLTYEDDNGEYVLAMHDYQPEGHDINCLTFQARQIIRVLNRDPSGWWDGEVEGRRGWFPSNYVTCEVGLLTEEELPDMTRSRSRHIHNASVSSNNPWTTPSSRAADRHELFSRTDHRPLHADGGGTADIYCPPLMRPLLHGLSLLQKAARENRVAHFQPSTAFIISCVRAILSDVGCFQRDAPILKRHGILAQERKRILSDLASLVTQARKASEEDMGDDLRELEVEAMVRLGGNLFAHVRGLLALLAQCGIRLPAHGGLPPGSTLGTQTQSSEDTAVSDDGGAGHEWGGYEKSTNGIVHRPSSKQVVPSTSTPMRAKSMGDLKAQRPRPSDGDVAQMPTDGHYKVFGGSLRQSSTPRPNRYTAGVMVRHEAGNSVSSNSSSSSFSSIDSIATPATPAFPSGPSTTPEVMEALRYTHDQYLSTIAAFIGHTHWHSRSTHASSTGHMYGLIREVVDMVCKLLTIVDAVLKHPDLPAAKSAGLKTAKEALYTITGKLVDSVRSLTLPAPEGMSEEEEKSLILHCATDALKVGADCVAAVKKCLRRATGERPFIIHLPTINESDIGSPRKFSQYVATHMSRPSKSSSFHALRQLYVTSEADGDDQDLTIQARTLSSPEVTLRIERQSVASPTEASLPNPWQPPEPTSLSPTFPSSNKPLPPLRIPSRDVSPDFPSPVSLTHTEDDRTTWEGSDRRPYSPASFDEQVLRGGLPAGPEPMRRTLVAWTLSHDHAEDDVAYNSDGQLVGATLSALVERMTPHDSVPEQAFSSVFFLTFRLFSTPMDLVGAIVDRYNIKPPAGLNADEVQTWTQRKGFPIRLRVSNFVKIWLETHWRPAADNVALSTLLDFTRDCLTEISVQSSQRILELIAQWQSTDEAGSAVKADRAREALVSLNPPSVPLSEVPRPVMTKNLLNALRQKSFTSIAITDFDPLELARQMTTMESQLYCAIKPEEVLETGKEGATSPINVKAVTSMSTAITGFVAESILNEPDTKKRTSLVKFFIKLADRCNSLSNFSTLRAILAALDSSTISRLHQTWQGLSQKYKMQLESLRKLSDHARNYHEYRSRLRNTAPPAIPFLGLYLTDVTFCREGNPSFRPSPKSPDKKLLNFNKYHKLARIVQDMQRFQTPYNLKQIPEVQEYLRDAFERSARQGDLQDLYRRSLMVEPKHSTDTPPTSDVRQLFNWTRSQSHQPTPTSASAL